MVVEKLLTFFASHALITGLARAFGAIEMTLRRGIVLFDNANAVVQAGIRRQTNVLLAKDACEAGRASTADHLVHEGTSSSVLAGILESALVYL